MMVLCALLMFLAACTDDPAPTNTMKISVFGWGPDATGMVSFQQGLPLYEGAAYVRFSLTKPNEQVILQRDIAPLSAGNIALPEIPYGEGLRLEVEVLDLAEAVLATGATPLFDYSPDDKSRALRIMIMPVNRFAPSGSIEINANNERVFVQSRYDYRAVVQESERPWLGRVGHVALPTSDGKVLIVGGADVIPGAAPGTIPKFRTVHRDVQLFDPETGYFTDLSYEELGGQPLPPGKDRLEEARAFHTVTPIGEDKFVVIGGYTERGGQSRPVRTIEMIDLNKPAGQRVSVLNDLAGSPLELSSPRGFHTAVYRAASQQIVLVGGLGQDSNTILSSVDAVNLQALTVQAGLAELSTARTEHTMLLLDDGSIWVLGGRNTEGVLASTELLEFGELSVNVAPGPTMNEPRFAFGTAVIRDLGGTRVIVVGGFTSLEGDVTGSYEIGVKGREVFDSSANWVLAKPRGGHNVVLLPNSGDLLILGGQDKARETIGTTERLLYKGLTSSPPYQVVSEGLGAFQSVRVGASVSQMTNGQLLITGGVGKIDDTLIALDNAELYNPDDPVAGGVFFQ